MKKILLFCFAIAALSFTSCDKESEDTAGYTFSISPSEVTIGESITLTITGDNVGDMSWTSCYTNSTTGAGSCLMPGFVNGVATISTTGWDAGEYQFYAECTDADVKTNYAYVTFNE